MTTNVAVISPNAQMVIGMIPCFNEFFLTRVWEHITGPLEELAQQTLGEVVLWSIRNKIYHGQLHLYLGYIDHEGTATQDKFQEVMTDKLRTPGKDLAGFAITELREQSWHIYAAYLFPEYRNLTNNFLGKTMTFFEDMARKAKAPYISLASLKDSAYQRFGYSEISTNYRKKL